MVWMWERAAYNCDSFESENPNFTARLCSFPAGQAVLSLCLRWRLPLSAPSLSPSDCCYHHLEAG